MEPLEACVVLYVLILAVLSGLGVHRYFILWLYFRHRRETPAPAGRFDELPRLTVQIPLYNELHVAARAIDHACRLDYPLDRLQIQVLDDSTDETTEICRGKIDEYRARGFDIELHHRDDRSGYKAGALAAATVDATGDLIAIFDADFLPHPGIVRQMIDHFVDPTVGMVQSRWGHVNRTYSTLTQVQAIFLDGHVVLEQTARNRSGRWFNFDGTGGIWRKEAIAAGGGWEGDTLGEDVDLSFRTQMAGYRFVFLKDVVCDAELPVDMNAFKSQQHRWIKGHCQIARKLLPSIWRCPTATRAQKSEATIQLLRVYTYPLVVALMLLMLPMTSARTAEWRHVWLWFDLPVFLAATTSVWTFYLAGQREEGGPWLGRVRFIPMVISVGCAIALSNSRAILEALGRHQSEFVRTPKYGVVERTDGWLDKRYDIRPTVLPLLELALGVYLSVAFVSAVRLERWLSLPFLSLFVIGYLYTGAMSLSVPIVRVLKGRRRRQPLAQAG